MGEFGKLALSLILIFAMTALAPIGCGVPASIGTYGRTGIVSEYAR